MNFSAMPGFLPKPPEDMPRSVGRPLTAAAQAPPTGLQGAPTAATASRCAGEEERPTVSRCEAAAQYTSATPAQRRPTKTLETSLIDSSAPEAGVEVSWLLSSRLFDKQSQRAVSEEITVTFPGEVANHTFIIMLKPRATLLTYQKGAADFKRAEGRGTATVKCQTINADSPQLEANICMTVGSGPNKQMSIHQMNDFKDHPAFTMKLTQSSDQWDFLSGMDETQHCPLFLSIVPVDSASSSSQAFPAS